MARLSYLVVDGLAFVLSGVGLTAAILGNTAPLNAPTMQRSKAGAILGEPVETGSIKPKAEDGRATKAAPSAGSHISSAEVTPRAWVDPPHRRAFGGQADPMTDRATGLSIR